ncbi:hypothetical protein Ae168Ps1_0421 [Pseudonocardia sp. Ae168_Ps1]|uniref:hypothetical protein n=1 Tax=unclassified Pseudonocardia TaxID=2619320 RepID=UPI0006CB1706|nr:MULTISPECIES: hypothetical protein [unclassified Pseudonocardia]ALE73588.1 hypothetical protein FRP1_11920 [Pseudonocardia sp. EC080625-04]ALL76880.1 hypothetical protein AD006_19055 [Pseudonocardia sp. EC080610-09]ALL83911.1 hypothetical protein AD017_26895 [Pseudonocardia sp. EC080619-01]OLL72049.1 hypothetical protein Ae150APs1_0427 [Pseudonocardia sp. Ae150A_Ps1]OLL78015.1 hypothetical protein Ae168Ps1_0421 [Pseudonocardia sp. Ae168_Ps1]
MRSVVPNRHRAELARDRAFLALAGDDGLAGHGYHYGTVRVLVPDEPAEPRYTTDTLLLSWSAPEPTPRGTVRQRLWLHVTGPDGQHAHRAPGDVLRRAGEVLLDRNSALAGCATVETARPRILRKVGDQLVTTAFDVHVPL